MHGALTFLAYFKPTLHFHTPWIYRKTRGFLIFSGEKEMEH